MSVVIYRCNVGDYSVNAEQRVSYGRPFYAVYVVNQFGRIESESICAESVLRARFMYYVRKMERETGFSRSDMWAWGSRS